jgi:integrase
LPGGKRRYEITFLDSTGKRRWRTVEGNLAAAEAALDQAKVGTRRGERTAPPRLTVAQAAEAWLPIVKAQVRRRTYVGYEGALRLHVLPRFGRVQLAKVDEDDVGRLIAEMQERGYSAWTIRGVLTPLSRLFGHAARRGLIAANPVARLERGERPRLDRKDKRVLDGEEIGRLLDAATTPRYRMLLATAIYTGLRISELLGLAWSDVDLDGGYLHVRKQLDLGKRVEPKTRARCVTSS